MTSKKTLATMSEDLERVFVDEMSQFDADFPVVAEGGLVAETPQDGGARKLVLPRFLPPLARWAIRRQLRGGSRIAVIPRSLAAEPKQRAKDGSLRGAPSKRHAESAWKEGVVVR